MRYLHHWIPMPLTSAALLSAVFQHLPDGVFLIDPHTSNILDCNLAALDQVGLARHEVLDHSVLSLQKDVVGFEQWGAIAGAIRASESFVFIGQHRHKSGAEVPVEVHTSHFMQDGQEYFLSVARNITQRVALEQELQSRDTQLRFALTEASDGLWDWNLQTNEVFFSPQLKRMLGYGPHEMAPTLDTWSNNLHPDDATWVRRSIDEHIAGLRERYECEYRLKNRNGHYLWVHDRGRVCEHDAQGRPARVVGMVHNITDRKSTELALQELAIHDPLTGLLNRRECERLLAQQLALCARLEVPMGLCFFDLDHFKTVNDRFGHQAGDQVLQQVAEVIGRQVRATDHLFRWGGEEFLLVCTNTPLKDMAVLANKLRMSIEQLQWPAIAGLESVTCSFGLASFPEHATDATSAFLAADTALYRAKANGRNQVELAGPSAPARADPSQSRPNTSLAA
jgi:diguanylate cyclase (GGDEF)-like protein/PAS domain S-box-containing protein